VVDVLHKLTKIKVSFQQQELVMQQTITLDDTLIKMPRSVPALMTSMKSLTLRCMNSSKTINLSINAVNHPLLSLVKAK
jgi:hypothetical protein